VGGVRLVDLELETLRHEVALVTQEQHVFVGAIAHRLHTAHDADRVAVVEDGLLRRRHPRRADRERRRLCGAVGELES
jgi:ABC-type multidrug transport system fused ATPase/permease subunit